MTPEINNRHHGWDWEEQPPITITISAGRRRRHRCCGSSTNSPSPKATSVAGMIAMLSLIATASAFVSRQSHQSSLPLITPGSSPSSAYTAHKSFLPAVPNNGNGNGPLSYARTRRKIRPIGTTRSTSLSVSLESPSTTSESDQLTQDVEQLSIGHNLTQSHNATLPDIAQDLIEDTSETLTQEVFIPMGETDERRMEPTRMGDDVEELTHLLAHDQADLQPLMSPSIPISYDEYGMVQADATPYAAAVLTNGAILQSTGGAAAISINEAEDYPAFIQFLFRKDEHGQTLASKLFNAALLAASFGYVISIVFNIDRGMTRGWTPTEIGMRIPLDTWASYENSLSEKPVATKTIINIVIYLLGDWLSQTLFQSKNILDFDAARTLKNGFIGMCFGPVVHEYYEFSDWILPVDGETVGVTNRAFKILMDQTVYLSVKCSIYILAIGVLNGESVQNSSDNVKNRIKPIMFAAWKFWPLVHCVTYGLIPARHRILWVNSVDLVWNAILASKARDDDDEEDGDDSMGGSDVLGVDGKVLEASDGDGGNNGEELDLFQQISAMLPSFDSLDDDGKDEHDSNVDKTPKLGLSDDDNENTDSKKTTISDSKDDNSISGAQWEEKEESSDTKTLLVKD